ncbi:MAG TPA: SCO family protein [Rhizomicrobium sp.]|jgi:protein SCO1/2
MNRVPVILLGVALVFALAAAGLMWRAMDQSGGEMAGAAPIGGPFRLIDQDGRIRSDRDFRGHWVLLYFGYTSCPDVCPATLQNIADALPRLKAKARNIVPVFVTLDPDRDHPQTLKRYLASFGPQFVGLTGTLPQITAIAHAYRVYFAKHPLPGGDYSVDHASTIYLLSPAGTFVTVFDTQEGAAALAKDIAARI